MRISKEILLLAAVIIALSLYLFLHKRDGTHYALPDLPTIDDEDVTGLEIQRGGKTIELGREGERWYILPNHYPADTRTADSLRFAITHLTLTAMASQAGNDALYDLDEAHRVRVTAREGKEVLRQVDIGKPAPTHQHTFVKLPGDPRIFHAYGSFRSRFEKDVDALRDKQVMKIDDQINELILAEGDRSLHLIRSVPAAAEGQGGEETTEAEPVWRTSDGKAVKQKEVEGLVRTLSNLRCDGFVEGKGKEDYRSPVFTVDLKGARDYAFSLYEEPDEKFVATTSESDYPFHIPAWRVKRLRLDLDDLLDVKE